MTDDELFFWRRYLPYVADIEGLLGMPGAPTSLSHLISELERYRKDRDAEERRAWDEYAAAYTSLGDSRSYDFADPGVASHWADKLLAERRKRFPAPDGKR